MLKEAISLIITNKVLALAGKFILSKGTCESNCSVFSRPHKRLRDPDSAMFRAKLLIMTAIKAPFIASVPPLSICDIAKYKIKALFTIRAEHLR